MQCGKNVASSMKEKAENVAASAKTGMEKTKASVQEKVKKMTTRDPVQKEMAMEKKEARKDEAAFEKLQAQDFHAQKRRDKTTGGGPYTHSTTGATVHPTGTHQMSAVPDHETGEPAGGVVEGVVGSHPTGYNTGTGHATANQNPNVGGGTNKGYGTGGAYG